MVQRRKHEPTRPGNPSGFAINQHVHSRACIERFANVGGLVSVWEFRNDRCKTIGAKATIFGAQRVWDERFERGAQTRSIEAAFLAESDTIIKQRRVTNHETVTAYLSLWQIRAELHERPPDDIQIGGLDPDSSMLTKEQEENVESKHCAFARGDRIPGRFIASIEAMRRHDLLARHLSGLRWGVLRASGKRRYICPDRPDRELAIPLTRTLALVAGFQDQDVGDEAVVDLNRQSLEHAYQFVFGHPDDIRELRAASQAGNSR